MFNDLCPMFNAQFPMPNAHCPVFSVVVCAQCPVSSLLTGEVSGVGGARRMGGSMHQRNVSLVLHRGAPKMKTAFGPRIIVLHLFNNFSLKVSFCFKLKPLLNEASIEWPFELMDSLERFTLNSLAGLDRLIGL